MALLFANNASGTLASTLNAGVTSAVLNSGEGALFPSPTGGDTFYATIEDASGNIEIVSCTARSSDTLTIVRAQQGTSDQTWASGDRFEMRPSAGDMEALLQATAASATYAPLTHFAVDGNSARLLEGGTTVTETHSAGLSVLSTIDTSTTLYLYDEVGTQVGYLSIAHDGPLALRSSQISQDVYIQGTTSAGASSTMMFGRPDSYTELRYQSSGKIRTNTYGAQLLGENTLAPYNAGIKVYNDNLSSLLAEMGFIGSLTEFRIQSHVAGQPMTFYADNSGGTPTILASMSPGGAVTLYYAGSSKLVTTSTGAQVNGQLNISSSPPTQGQHAARKDYVDSAVEALEPNASSYGTNGYKVDADGFTREWGVSGNLSGNQVNVSFPRAFTTVYNVQVTPRKTSFSGGEDMFGVGNVTNSGFTIYGRDLGVVSFYWEAKGLS